MLGQIVFCTSSDTENAAIGTLAGGPVHPGIVTAVGTGSLRTLTVFLPSGQPTWVRRDVPAGDPGQAGTWNAAAA